MELSYLIGQKVSYNPKWFTCSASIRTDWVRGRTHSICSERGSAGSWRWGACMNQRGSPCPHYLTGERFCLENKNTINLKHLSFFFFFPVTCKMKLLVLRFLTKYFLVPCQSGLEKAKAWANWNLQVSNSHFSFSTWSFALLGFLQLGCCFNWHLQSFSFLEQKLREMLMYPMGADQQGEGRKTCLGSLWWERQDNHYQNIPWVSFLLTYSNFLAPLLLH